MVSGAEPEDRLLLGAPPERRPPGRERSSERPLRSAALGFLGSAGLLVLALVVLAGSPALVQVVLVGAGLVLARRSIDVAARARWGNGFDTTAALCAVWLTALVLAALLADLLPLAEGVDPGLTLREPGNLPPDLFSSHPLGTNNLSLDLLSRSIHGARVSLLTSLMAILVSLVVGGLLGILAGYLRGPFDAVVGVVTNTVLAFPALVFLIAVITTVGRPTSLSDATVKLGLALGVIATPTMARLARATTLSLAQQEFVVSARGMGASRIRVVLRELVPNVAYTLVSLALVIMAVLILAEGSLSFLGLGLQPPSPSWGNMIADGQETAVLREQPYIPLVPGAFMFLTVFSFNRLGERLRTLTDRS